MKTQAQEMAYYVLKVLISAVLIVLISELGKRSSLFGAILASIPAVSVLAFVWMYLDTGETAKVADLAASIFWLVLPSLVLFLILPYLLRQGWDFWLSLLVAVTATVVSYFGMILVLGRLGVEL